MPKRIHSMIRVSWLSVLLLTILFGLGVYFAINAAWSEVFVVLVAIVFSVVPYVLMHHYALRTTATVRTSMVFFVFCTLVLGEIYKFYSLFWWWDIFLHAAAGVGLAVVMYIWLRFLINQSAITNAPFFYSLFVFSTATTVLVFWEVYEFAIDQLGWSSNRMQPSLFDTMTDITVGLAGVLVVCIVGGTWLKQHQGTHNHTDAA